MALEREYDFWLLDLDGTLVDVEWSYTREVFDQVGDRLGREFTDQEADILWNGLTGSRDRQLEEWGVDPTAFWEAFHEEEDPLVRAEQTYLHEDAAFVADLEVPVGLVTHCQEFLCEPVLDAVGIRDWFDTRLCCTEETGWKPTRNRCSPSWPTSGSPTTAIGACSRATARTTSAQPGTPGSTRFTSNASATSGGASAYSGIIASARSTNCPERPPPIDGQGRTRTRGPKELQENSERRNR